MSVKVQQEPALMAEAFEVLFDQLGPAKVVRLWSALQVGRGDYLRFRETHFAAEDVASLVAKIEAFEAEERTPDTVGTE
jgi:hypothetical protein